MILLLLLFVLGEWLILPDRKSVVSCALLQYMLCIITSQTDLACVL